MGRETDRLDDHARLRTLHLFDFGHLNFRRHVAMDNSHPPFRASAIASRASVTVSMAADRMGMLSFIGA